MAILTQLHEERGLIVAAAKKILDSITDDTPEGEAEELRKKHDEKMDEYDKLNARIAREERQLAAENAEEERRSKNRPAGGDGSAPGVDGGEEPSAEDLSVQYRSAFAKHVCGVEMTAEERSILRRGFKPENRAQLAGQNDKGGFTVPTTLMKELVRVMKDWGPMMDSDIVRSIVTGSGNPWNIPTVDDTGVEAEDYTEGAGATDDGGKDVTLGQQSLGAYAIQTEWIRWSWELDEDSIFAMESLLADLLGERLGRKGNQRLTVGSGNGQAHGIVTASSEGVVAASNSGIAPDEVIDFFHSVNAAYRRSPKCRWQFADKTLAVLRKLKDGQGNYLWSMGDIRIDQPDTLLQKPYSINDDVPEIAPGATPMIFGDHSRYYRRQVGGIRTLVVDQKFAPDMGILGLARFDGELIDANAIKHFKMAA